MNKPELIHAIAEKTRFSKRDVTDIVNAFLDIVTQKLIAREEVSIAGFGAFSTRTRKGRMGVNPRNLSQKIQIGSVTVPKFKPGKTLKDAVKKKPQI
jgi:DNA-binding protein HU-beta